MVKLYILVVAATCLLVACGDAAQSADLPPESGAGQGAQLVVVSEIGVELGDSNYVFGIIQDADFTPEGNIAVLDSQKKRIRVFSPDGLFLGTFGGAGEAPGEFLNPRSIACLSDGRIAVSDPFGSEVEIFNRDYSHSETIADFTERAPFVITATAQGFAGEQGGFNRDEGTITTNLVSWNLADDSVTILMSNESLFSPENMAARLMQPEAGIAASGNLLFYAPPVTEDYSVYFFQIESDSSGTLRSPGYSPRSKTQQELQEEMQTFEDRMQAMASSGRGRMMAEASYDPPPHYYATSAIGVDSSGRIWVQRGWEHVPTFDLFNPGETEPSQTITVSGEEDLSGYTFVVSPFGMAAFNPDPEDYPQILILELQSGQ